MSSSLVSEPVSQPLSGRVAERVVPVAHVEDAPALDALLGVLRDLHGAGYAFAVRHWEGETRLAAPEGRAVYRFVIQAEGARVTLRRGAVVRGPAPGGPYARLAGGGELAEVTAGHAAPVWPGDVLASTAVSTAMPGGMAAAVTTPLVVAGRGRYLEVVAEESGYPAPVLAMLRHLPDRPRGCAAYEGAFRREALPPDRAGERRIDAGGGPASPAAGAPNGEHAAGARGTNRVNEHTLDMRSDRVPGPTTHYHGPVPCGLDGSGRAAYVSHSETAIVLPRAAYGLPEVGGREDGWAVIYRRPAEDPSDTVRVPLRPGSILVTPAAPGYQMGHRFENAFAMLVAIPGFVSPTSYLQETES